MKRRDFMNWVGVGAIASFLPVAIAACQSDDNASAPTAGSGSSEPEIDSTPRDDGFAAIGTVAQLDEDGFISDKTFQGEQVLVVRDPNDDSALVAVNSMCTHQGCSVEWDGSGVFVCPCHSSQFNPDGSVAQGPAGNPLGKFDAKIEDDLVLVAV